MSSILIWIVTAIYAGQATVFTFQGNLPGALVFFGYAVANLGLIWGFGK